MNGTDALAQTYGLDPDSRHVRDLGTWIDHEGIKLSERMRDKRVAENLGVWAEEISQGANEFFIIFATLAVKDALKGT